MTEREQEPSPGDGQPEEAEPGQASRGEPSDSAAEPEDPTAGYFYQPHTNQLRQEPMPASHEDERWQEAVRRNEEHAHGVFRQDSPARHGRAVRRLTPGDAVPGPLEPVTQLTGGEGEQAESERGKGGPGEAGRRENEQGGGGKARPARTRRVSQVAPTRPDGEVNPGR